MIASIFVHPGTGSQLEVHMHACLHNQWINTPLEYRHAQMPSYLPVLCDSIPHPNLPRMACSYQLVSDEEEIIHWYTKTEHTWGGKERDTVVYIWGQQESHRDHMGVMLVQVSCI